FPFQSAPDGFLTSIVWLSEIGDASWRYIEVSMRRSQHTSGAYSARRLKQRDVTAMFWPFAVTAKEPSDGAMNCRLLSTRSHCETRVGSGFFVLINFTSRSGG